MTEWVTTTLDHPCFTYMKKTGSVSYIKSTNTRNYVEYRKLCTFSINNL